MAAYLGVWRGRWWWCAERQRCGKCGIDAAVAQPADAQFVEREGFRHELGYAAAARPHAAVEEEGAASRQQAVHDCGENGWVHISQRHLHHFPAQARRRPDGTRVRWSERWLLRVRRGTDTAGASLVPVGLD